MAEETPPPAPPPSPVASPEPQVGNVVMRAPDGRLYEVGQADVGTQAQNLGWQVAGDAEVQRRVEERRQFSQYGGAGQQAQALLETGVRTATLGAVPGFGAPEEVQGRSEFIREESPVATFLAQSAGAALPALAGGGVAGLAARGVGLGTRAVGAGQVLAEGAASGYADEAEEARATGRDVSAGNVLMFGLGGEIIGRGVPAVLRKGMGAARSRLAGEVASETAEGALAKTERKALESSADVADGVPHGPDRDTFLVGAEKGIVDTASQRAAQSLDTLHADMAELTADGGKRTKLRNLVPETNAEQRQWAADTSQDLLNLRDELRPRPSPPADAPLPEGAPRPVSYRDIPGLKKPAADLDRTLTEGSKRLDDATTGADWFDASGEVERSLFEQERAIGRIARSADPLDQGAAQELLGRVQEARRSLRLGRERPDLWGGAGDLQKSLNGALEDNWRPGSEFVSRRFGQEIDGSWRSDAGKIRGHFQADEVGRGVAPEFLEKQLAGAEQVIAAHRKFGTASEAQLSRMEKAVESLRQQSKIVDDVRGAKARASEKAGAAKESARYDKDSAGSLREQMAGDARARAMQDAKDELISGALGAAVGAVAGSLGLGAVVAMGSKALRVGRLLGTLGRTGDAAIGSAARGAVLGSAARGLRAAEAGLGRAGGAAVPFTTTALTRFQGDYPTVQASFEAKRRTLEEVAQNPLALAKAATASLDPVGRVNPQLQGEIAARLMTIANYLYQNLPSQISASMTRPSGIPMSRTTARDFALKYTAATEPASVLADIRDGTATPTQLKALEACHPDIYQGLRIHLARVVSETPDALSTQRKIRLDILFGGDGMAGRAFAWPLAMAIQKHRQGRATGAVAQGLGGGFGKGEGGAQPPARGTSNIGNSVTNAA